MMARHTPERDVITQHYVELTDTISSDLVYFPGKFIEKGFLTDRVANNITSQNGVGRGEKANLLLEALLTNLQTFRDKVTWFLAFIRIFSTEAAYSNLADRMQLAYEEARRNQPLIQNRGVCRHIAAALLLCGLIFAITLVVYEGTCCPQSLNSTDQVHIQNIEEEVRDIEGNFTGTILQMIQVFRNCSIDVPSLMTALYNLRINSKYEVPKLLDPYKNDIKDIKTIAEMFQFLSGLEPPLWDIRNYHLPWKLTEVLLKDESFNLRTLFNKHRLRLEEFEKRTSFCLYSRAKRGTDVKPSKHYELIDIELKRPCINYSISEYELVRRDLFGKILGLTPYSILFKEETKGSIHQWWLIPKSIIPYLKKELPKTKSFCNKYGIVAVRLNNVNLLARQTKYLGPIYQKSTSVGDNFVRIPFHLVVVITFGVISVRSWRLAFFICYSAISIYFYSIYQQNSISFTTEATQLNYMYLFGGLVFLMSFYVGYAYEMYTSVLSQPLISFAISIHLYNTYLQNSLLLNTAWKGAPAIVFTQSEIYEYLVLGLFRWIASFIYSVFVCKTIARILPLHVVVATVFEKWFVVLPICAEIFLHAGRDFSSLRPITNDRGIYFYLISAQMIDAVRAAFQVALTMNSREVTKFSRNDSRCNIMIHIFVLSSLVLFRNVLSNEFQLCSVVDIILQLLLMKQTSWAYIVNFVRLLFLPFGDDILLEYLINPQHCNWLFTDCLDNDINDKGIALATTSSEYSLQHKPFIQAPSVQGLKQWSILHGSNDDCPREISFNKDDSDQFQPNLLNSNQAGLCNYDVGIFASATTSSVQHKPFIQELKTWSTSMLCDEHFSRERSCNDSYQFLPYPDLAESDLLLLEPSIYKPALQETKSETSSQLVSGCLCQGTSFRAGRDFLSMT